ncbi:MAG: 4-hydroxy-tetrahydrodipicolinate reductase [Alphaproteobacteria bacterium]|nr:4-hydroxy-tetrahydrodipicolinate reductase [Alphaproteobacteria bacterium]
MVPLAVVGATGRMGRRAVALAAEHGLRVVAAVGSASSSHLGADAGRLAGLEPLGVPVVAPGPDAFGEAEVVLDVSLPEGLLRTLEALDGRALVTGVTGLDERLRLHLEAAAEQGPVLHAANFSAGVQVLAELVRRAAGALPELDVEIVETHHRLKVDAPSGTALLLADAVAEARHQVRSSVVRHGREGATGPRPPGEIGLHAVRGGDVVGEHTVWLLGEGERLELGHVATSRDTFVRGALRAAAWLHDRPAGRYAFREVLGLA